MEVRKGRAWQAGCGWFGQLGTGEPVERSTLYDLASLTKPAVACTLVRLARAGSVGLDEPLSDLLPAVRGTPSAPLPLHLFASHRAGLCAHIELGPAAALSLPLAGHCPGAETAPEPSRPSAGAAPTPTRARTVRLASLRQAASARRPDCSGAAPAEGFAPLYSDLGFVLLGASLEARTGEPLDALVRREVATPLGLELDSARGWHERVGLRRFEREAAPTERLAHRGGLLRGQVHDDNAYALAGLGVAGHAGLFGTAEAVARFGAAVLGAQHDWLPEQALELLLRPRPGGPMRLGFDGLSGANSSAGAGFPPSTFGHLGFTGTSFWCDPKAHCSVALLTNRVFPTRHNVRIRDARRLVHSQLRTLALSGAN